MFSVKPNISHHSAPEFCVCLEGRTSKDCCSLHIERHSDRTTASSSTTATTTTTTRSRTTRRQTRSSPALTHHAATRHRSSQDRRIGPRQVNRADGHSGVAVVLLRESSAGRSELCDDVDVAIGEELDSGGDGCEGGAGGGKGAGGDGSDVGEALEEGERGTSDVQIASLVPDAGRCSVREVITVAKVLQAHIRES